MSDSARIADQERVDELLDAFADPGNENVRIALERLEDALGALRREGYPV